MLVVTAVIERADRRILIGQRRKIDTSPLKWEFPGGKVWDDEVNDRMTNDNKDEKSPDA